MQLKPGKRPRSDFFFFFALVGLAAVLIGFAKTFIQPVAAGTFKAPATIYLHGAFAFSWILLFLIQTVLIRRQRYRLHMRLGISGIVFATGTAITMLPAGVYEVNKHLADGWGETAISGFLGVVSSALMFASLVTAGMLYRKQPKIHKRLMLLATIVVLWPAWFRFRHYLPSVTRPEIWFAVVLADSWILVSCIWDKWKNGSIHPVLKYLGAAIILEHIVEIMLFDSPGWRSLAKLLYQAFS